MSEQENCPIPVHLTSGGKNTCSGENVSYQGGIEPIRENPTSVRILEEFRHIYEERLRKIDEEMGSEGVELKLKTLTSWVNDLGEQNLMLVETVEQLEREAAGRVSLLEERLKKSSHVALEYMSKLEEYDNQIWNLSEEKGIQMVFPFKASNGLMQVQQTEEILKTRVGNLQNDISCLLELIQRARYKGSWDTNGLNFLEVTYEDIFGPHPHQVPGGFLNPVVFDGSVLAKNSFGNPELDSASWKEKSTLETAEMKDLSKKLEDTNSHLQKIMKENECLVKEIEFLSAELKTKTDRISTLSQNSFELDKNELEYRVMDLEATYLRLEKSWDHAWEISKNGALMDDLIYYQNALEERSTGDSKSCTFEMPEKTICTGGIKKDQERIRELCGEIKALLQSNQQSSMKRGVSFASPSKEDYKLQVQELQKALKQAQNVAEIARKKITRNIIGLKAISKCNQPSSQEQSYSRKMKEMNVTDNILSSFFRNNYEIFDSGVLDRPLNLKKYFTDMSQSDLQISQYQMENVQKTITVLTPQKCTHCNNLYKKNNDAFNLMEKLQMEIDTLKSTVSAKEKVILDQQEMLNIQQEALIMSQEEVKELQSQLKNLECYNENESKQVQEQLTTISNLHQDLITTKHRLEEFQERSCFNISFEDEEKRNKALQSRCQDFERKFQEAREYWLILLKHAQIIEQEIIKHDCQQTKVMKIIMPVIACIKHFCSKFLVEEGNFIRNDFNSGLKEHGSFELVRLFPDNEESTMGGKNTTHTGVVSLVVKNLEEEFEDMNVHNPVCDKVSKSELFQNFHLNELRKLLDAQAFQRKITGKHKCNLPMSYSEAINYCNYMELEINKLQDLLVDFQFLMSPIEFDIRGQIDFCSTQAKVENLEMALNETSENYKKASIDCYKYQEQLLHAAEREVVLQEDFTEKERYWLETMYNAQEENFNYADALHTLNEEIELLQLELNERDCQLQNTASSLRGVSIESSFLQKELQKQELNVEKLEKQLLHNNIKLQQALSYLDEKNNLLLKLDRENQNIQDRLKNLEIKFQNCMSSEKYIFLQEISNLKTSIQQLKKCQEKSNLEVREHWWWDDGWQI